MYFFPDEGYVKRALKTDTLATFLCLCLKFDVEALKI